MVTCGAEQHKTERKLMGVDGKAGRWEGRGENKNYLNKFCLEMPRET